jgi:hypothetical protein
MAAKTMTTQEFAKLEAELEAAEVLYGKEFDDWYEQARMTTVDANCRTGWMLWRIKRKLINDQIDKDANR